ncbi:sigma-54-dependent transcriptional regulator [Undibacterium flavidum]|uniref:Sigma-54-dependent Fis family transcriptional regulator n=1 Tax=Undibacterium flavidum TaxID=2762297 RepID=A0ABR6YBK8_9BURK|nr:sigma-54 dependent transcriptional regulator [Undibacterium flavidum]MBC3874015.1 sigma-54-dependent Fis family transcriptional regulator [Undibacterium flavidum]
MLHTAKLLVIDDDFDVATAARLLLQRHYAEVRVAHSPEAACELLQHYQPDCVLLDFNFTKGYTDGKEGLALLKWLHEHHPKCKVIAMTAYADVPLAVAALKLGATDFITKPWDNARLVATVSGILHQAPVQNTDACGKLLGSSSAMQALRNMINNVAPTEANVLILGENGVGKELVAQALHQGSPRKQAPFLAVDMGALAESTLESELFGYKKGAFTDARSDKQGRFQAARGGVIFLDEIGNLPLAGQAKLLTALERREVTPIGSNQSEKIQVRVVSATNLSETELYDPTRFRTDLLFRLNTIVLRVPALREHAEDIPLLLEHYLQHYQQAYQKPARQLSASLIQQLCQHAWKGNIRELKHACERAVILGIESSYQLQDFGVIFDNSQSSNNASKQTEQLSLEVIEKNTIQSALNQTTGNMSAAAKLLGLSRAALYRKLEKHGL